MDFLGFIKRLRRHEADAPFLQPEDSAIPRFRRVKRAVKVVAAAAIAGVAVARVVSRVAMEARGRRVSGGVRKPRRARVIYRSRGGITERDIVALRVERGTAGLMLHAFCRLRKAHRTFNVAQIVSLTDLETGEVFENGRDIRRWVTS